MTKEEKIKQNAEEYILPLKTLPCADENITFIAAIREAFIAGAHSRDEEIEELKKQRDNFKDRLLDALEKRDQLRYPWHSADELPKENPSMKGYSLPVIVNFGNMYYERAYVSLEERIWFQGGITTEKPIAWMYIPELKKGE